MRRLAKSLLGRALFRLTASSRRLGDSAVITLFHRVDSSIPANPITIPERDFSEFCRFFGRYFDVISLKELVARIGSGRAIGGSLVVTFDDGYEDNVTVAAPILRHFGLPATFFIATGFIGTERQPWWDRQWKVDARWMGWDQVRLLRGLGFDIGAHTVNHVDLGKTHGAEARREIVESRETLERELGESINLFSYPYGRPSEITERNRRLVRELGFDCCPSAHGGLVRPGDDPFRLARQPISTWHRSPWQFGWEMSRAAEAG